jgi:uncharacterized SAM-binding protein YcdF (DUF218 family)
MRNLLSALLLPPSNLILLGFAGILLLRHCPRLGRSLATLALTLLYLLSTPIIAEGLLHSLEILPQRHPFDTSVQAIVVLGADTYFSPPEYDAHTVGRLGLERVRYAARLYRRTGKPIMATGGTAQGNGFSEAAQMKTVLEEEFRVPVRWVEKTSRNTRENAYKSLAILQKDGIDHIALVTHAWHMPRAMREFEQAGFNVTPAPTAFTTRYRTGLMSFIPTANALQKSWLYFHEITGMLWYRLVPVSRDLKRLPEYSDHAPNPAS